MKQKNKLQSIREEGRNTLIAIVVIGIAVYLGFTPLFEKIQGGVAGAVVGASFGAIFVIVLTMYLLNKQTEIEQENKKSEKVFEEKMNIYSDIFKKIEKMLEDGKISKNDEMHKLPFVMVRLLTVGSDKVIKSFQEVYNAINLAFDKKPDDETVELDDGDRQNIITKLSSFANTCRVDLGVSDEEVEAELYKKTQDIIGKGIKKGKAKGWMKIEEFLKECEERGRTQELIETTRKLHNELEQHYRSEPVFRIDIPDITQSQSQAKLKVKTGKGVFCDITLRTKNIRIGGIYKSPKWEYKQLKVGELFFRHDKDDPRKLLLLIKQIDERELKKILVVLDESKKVLEEKEKILPNYKKLAKKGDEKDIKEHEKHTAPDFTLKLNIKEIQY